MPRPDWSRPLPRPLTIPDVLTLETLTDVRTLVEKHLPAEYRSKFTWRQLAGLLKRAAEGQVAEVSTALRILLHVRLAGAHAAAWAGTSSVTTLNPVSTQGPKEVEMATSVASRPRAINMRPMRGSLCLASKVYQRSPK